MNSPNVIARTEIVFLRQAARSFNRRPVQLILVAINLSLALIPFLATDQYADIAFHTMIGAVLVCFCLGYEFYAIVTAVDSVEHEKRNRTWDNLILTGVDAHKIVFGKWQALLRHWRGIYLLHTASRLAIAYSVMQILNIHPTYIDVGITYWNQAFVYMSYKGVMSTSPIAYYPDLWQVITSGLLLTILSFAGLGFAGACGLIGAGIPPRLPGIKVVSALFIRIIFALVGIGLVFGIGALKGEGFFRHGERYYFHGCDEHSERTARDYYNWCLDERNQRRVFDTMQVSAATLTDSSILLAANVMRPIGTWQFALRNTLSAVISLTVIAVMTGMSLLAAS